MIHNTETQITIVKLISYPKDLKINLGFTTEVTTELHGREGCYKATIKNVLYIPDAPYGILSVEKLRKAGFDIFFKRSRVLVSIDYFEMTLFTLNNLVYFKIHGDDKIKIQSAYSSYNFYLRKRICDVWHARFNHLNKGDLFKVQSMVDDMERFSVHNFEECLTCIENKYPRKSFKKRRTVASKPLDVIYSDILGPVHPTTMGGNRKYVLVFIDGCTNYLWISLLKHKSDVSSEFEKFLREIERKVGSSTKEIHVVKRLHTDNAGEYLVSTFQKRLAELGIKHTTVIPYTPEQNGLAERYNRTLLEKTKCILNESGFPKSLWGEAILNVAYVLNLSPTSKLDNKTPYEALTSKRPSVKYLRKFGSLVYFHVPKEKRSKLDPNNRRGFLLGYSDVISQYRIYVPEDKTVILSSSVKILENISYGDVVSFNKHSDENLENLDSHFFDENNVIQIIPSESSNFTPPKMNKNLVQEVPESQNETIDVISEMDLANEKETETNVISDSLQRLPQINYFEDNSVPQEKHLDIQEAKNDPHWMQAIQKELSSIENHKVYEVVDKASAIGQTILDLRWVFTIKPGGLHKARLVAKGFRQKGGIDYYDTYSPVIDIDSLRILLVYGYINNYNMLQLDVKTAFLYGNLDEEIYCHQPPGFSENNKIWKLKKSLYGLKQAPRCWNDRLHNHLTKIGFVRNRSQPCMYHHSDDVHLGVYVDDMILLAKTEKDLLRHKSLLEEEFEIKDLGFPKTILGINIKTDENEIHLSQQEYIDSILKAFKMSDCNGVSTPMTSGVRLQKPEVCEEKYPYRNAIGMLTYLSSRTRPDISFTVHKLAQFNNSYDKTHWACIKHLLRYLKKTRNFTLHYSRKKISQNYVSGYSDSDHGGDRIDRKSTSGYVFIFCGGPISWKSKKQSRQSLSSTEAEITAACSAVRHAIWMKNVFKDLIGTTVTPMIIKIDNNNAIRALENPVINSSTKHVEIDFFFVRHLVSEKELILLKCNSNENKSDGFTKTLGKEKHEDYLKQICCE